MTRSPQSPIKRSEVVTAARAYLGVPWRHQGRTREGLDCAGLVLRTGWDLGMLEGFDRADYPTQIPQTLCASICAEIFGQKSLADAKPGDIAVFRDLGSHWPVHMGILSDLLGDLGLVHAYVRARGVVECSFEASWRGKVAGIYYFPEVSA